VAVPKQTVRRGWTPGPRTVVYSDYPRPEDLLERYRQEDAYPVETDIERIRALGYQVVAEGLISTEDYVRHDPDKVAKIVVQLIVGARGRALAPAPAAAEPHASPSRAAS